MSEEWHNQVADTVYGLKLLQSHYIDQFNSAELDVLTNAIELLENKIFKLQ